MSKLFMLKQVLPIKTDVKVRSWDQNWVPISLLLDLEVPLAACLKPSNGGQPNPWNISLEIIHTFPYTPFAAKVRHLVDRQLSWSCHCPARGHWCKDTLPAEGPKSRGSQGTHGKTTQQPGCFSSQMRPISTRTTKISLVGDVLQAQCRQETQDHGGWHLDTKQKSCRSLFLKCCKQATVSLMPKKHCWETGTPKGLHCPIRHKRLGSKSGSSGESPIISPSSCWICSGSCSTIWATSLWTWISQSTYTHHKGKQNPAQGQMTSIT